MSWLKRHTETIEAPTASIEAAKAFFEMHLQDPANAGDADMLRKLRNFTCTVSILPRLNTTCEDMDDAETDASTRVKIPARVIFFAQLTGLSPFKMADDTVVEMTPLEKRAAESFWYQLQLHDPTNFVQPFRRKSNRGRPSPMDSRGAVCCEGAEWSDIIATTRDDVEHPGEHICMCWYLNISKE